MNDSSQLFASNQIEAIAKTIGEHLTMTEIRERLAGVSIPTDISEQGTKWRYLQETLQIWQDETHNRGSILRFIEYVMQPVNFISSNQDAATAKRLVLLGQLRAVLIACGLGLRDDGTVSADPIVTPISSESATLHIAHTDSPDTTKSVPPGITDSLTKFRRDNPDSNKLGFIIMSFQNTKAHNEIVETIRNTLAARGGRAVRADDKEYVPRLFENVQTYMHGCGFGIAVFERLQSNVFNPNVSFEIGYMLALGKSVCILKDKTIETLPSDLMGSLYKQFDPQDVAASLPLPLNKWLLDYGIA